MKKEIRGVWRDMFGKRVSTLQLTRVNIRDDLTRAPFVTNTELVENFFLVVYLKRYEFRFRINRNL